MFKGAALFVHTVYITAQKTHQLTLHAPCVPCVSTKLGIR